MSSHLVIGIFDSEFDAIAVVDKLLSHGFIRHNIHISDRSNTNRSLLAHENDDHEQKVARFFKVVFEHNEEAARKYTDVALESGAAIIVNAYSDTEAEKAAGILDAAGALQVDADDSNATLHKSRIVEWGEKQAAWDKEKRLMETRIWS